MKMEFSKDKEIIGSFEIIPFRHPQGCCGYLIVDKKSREALVLDVHLDLVEEMLDLIKMEDAKVRFIADTHTHADHPSGAAKIEQSLNCTRFTHPNAKHLGVEFHPKDGETIKLGESTLKVRYMTGHTPDHLGIEADGAFFSGDSLFIGGVARTDFLGGDAGTLFDSIQSLLTDLPDETTIFPGHDYDNKTKSTLGEEKSSNPWLQIKERESFIKNLTANPPPRPANMDALLKLNQEGVNIPNTVSASEVVEIVKNGGVGSIIDVRTGAEFESQHIAGSRLIPLDKIEERAKDVMATPAPRLILCQSGNRATTAKEKLEQMNIGGLSVITGGIGAYITAGGEVEKGKNIISLERQVRIVAGVLVILGIVMGYFINPTFLILSAFVACGLIFAGITDWCGMGLLLAKMPWNKSKATDSVSGGTCSAGIPSACSAAPPTACAAKLPPNEKE